jgi:hypothetical protein
MSNKKASSRQKLSVEMLPSEILMKIVRYLPQNERINVSLTSKAFNEIICELEKFKYPLTIKMQTVSLINMIICNFEGNFSTSSKLKKFSTSSKLFF